MSAYSQTDCTPTHRQHYYSRSAVCRGDRENHLALAFKVSKRYVGKYVFIFHLLENPFLLHSVYLKPHNFLVVKIYALYSSVTGSNLVSKSENSDRKIEVVQQKRAD